MTKRIRDYGIVIGEIKTGYLNKITDVDGVVVGHVTLKDENVNTGVTAIVPASGNLFENKLIASAHVFNGFGKSTGLVQIEELGTLETPILLTNTLSIGDAIRGLYEYKISRNLHIGDTTGTVNPVVCECNDAYLNDIRGFRVRKEHIKEAIESGEKDFTEGAVGAGTGMSAFTLKGGIGSSSRVIEVEAKDYTIGVLVMTNMGRKKNLIIDGNPVGKKIVEVDNTDANLLDKGSIIIILATDVPLNQNQLKRVTKRTIVGLSRTGSNMSHGSGEVVVGFTTANRYPHSQPRTEKTLIETHSIHDDHIDLLFDAVADATEESVLNSMITAESLVGRAGHERKSLKEYEELFCVT